jgi:bifunctional DNA-binding transcriptional regulator/antitoxin component of YhaV-PrlF toxin-antitoxin module
MAKETAMGYESKVQVIQRGDKNRQFYLMCPAPLAEALELEKGERIEWVVIDRRTLEIRRMEAPRRAGRKGHDA